MTLRRHPQLRALRGLGKATPPSQIYSERAWNTSQAVQQRVKQLKEHPLLAGARYNETAYQRAKAQASSIVETVSDMTGTTSLTKEDVQQLVLGGLNTLSHAANMLGFLALTAGDEARASETRLINAMDELATRTNALVRDAERKGTLQGTGLGFIMFAIIIGVIAYFIGANDQTTEVMRDVCTQHPASDACQRMIDNSGEWNPTKPAAEAAGKLIWWVGIGAAVLIGGYLLFTFGPALGNASSAVRSRTTRRRRRSLRGPRRVRDLEGPSLYNLEV